MSAANGGDPVGEQAAPHAPAPNVNGEVANEEAAEVSTGNPRRRPNNPNRRTTTVSSAFKGETGKLNGNVFQIHSERTNKSQFMDTIEALRVYSSSAYKNDIEALTILFTKLEAPTVSKPDDPIEET